MSNRVQVILSRSRAWEWLKIGSWNSAPDTGAEQRKRELRVAKAQIVATSINETTVEFAAQAMGFPL